MDFAKLWGIASSKKIVCDKSQRKRVIVFSKQTSDINYRVFNNLYSCGVELLEIDKSYHCIEKLFLILALIKLKYSPIAVL